MLYSLRSFRITYQVPDSLFALPHYFGDFIPRQCPLPSQGGFFGGTTRYQIPLRRSQLPKVDILWNILQGKIRSSNTTPASEESCKPRIEYG
ncbi:hypothetical protein M0657_010079 [Pyricularia oryzae]|uniref:Uncharacterized protein n=1 Tax=Pyricularia oryzae TaxID=318829 RepID=A0A4P7NUP3_PYROR|nr:hypothetical protein M9X92_010052 [Pyricularia oryzae]KAI7913307.1 hypothetical protein M0657_010079 [Pyricularia oryzae]QBZ65636.1 hypothetical protein PoMZ_12599 [Pyricularia oryzae]